MFSPGKTRSPREGAHPEITGNAHLTPEGEEEIWNSEPYPRYRERMRRTTSAGRSASIVRGPSGRAAG